MPIASGQLGLLLITGVADGLLGEGDTLHAVRGSENVFLKLHSRNWKQQRKKLYYKNAALKFIIATPTGEVKELV